jgi:hypothetical protein
MPRTGHNHFTRDIKPPGACPTCDEYRQRESASTEPVRFSEIMSLVIKSDTYISPDALLMAKGPDGLPMQVVALDVENHDEGGQTVWLSVEEF